MRREVTSFAGALVLGTLVACSGGAGTPDFTRGPDSEPGSPVDSPGDGREGPGTPGESPNTPSDPGSSCIDCEGTYACTAPAVAGSSTSYITLQDNGGVCTTLNDQGTVDGELLCGGQFLSIDNGQATLIGSWSGGGGHFTVSATLQGQLIVVDCVPGTNPNPTPQPQPGGGTGTNDVDAG